MRADISVVIPTFNRAPLLGAALDSVLVQSHPVTEIIVVDDGSTDGTRNLVEGYGERVRYWHQPRGGIGAARNAGVRLAQCSLIAFLDSDDLWAPEKLERQVQALEANPECALVFTNYQEIDNQGRVMDQTARVGVLISSFLVPSKSYRAVGDQPTHWRVGEFVEWIGRALDLGLAINVLPQVLTFRRVHAENTVVLNRDAYADYARILKQRLDRRRLESGNLGER